MVSDDAFLRGLQGSFANLATASPVVRRLSDLSGCFGDEDAYRRSLAEGDPIVYTVATVEPGSGTGDLHIGLGTLMPGRVGDEFFMTKGHLHAWRAAAEFYVGLRGKGGLLLEHEDGSHRFAELAPGALVYVPGCTAHRTVNTGSDPLAYLGVYPATAGHDYDAIRNADFRQAVLATSDGVMTRARASVRNDD